MKEVKFNKFWQGYGVITFTDVNEVNARKKNNVSLDFKISNNNGFVFVTEPALKKSFIICQIEITNYQIILHIKDASGNWHEKFYYIGQISNIKIYEI